MTLRSAARTMPSLARMPMAVPAWEMASRAYSTWYRRPSGEKMVVWGRVSCGPGVESQAARPLRHRAGSLVAYPGVVSSRHGGGGGFGGMGAWSSRSEKNRRQ